MRGIVFTRSGDLGGILFSLHFIRDCSEWGGADRALMPLAYGPCAVHPLGGERDVVQTIGQSVRLPGFLFR